MAKIINGILGGVSGLVGTVVGAVVRGVATIRSRPKKSTKAPVASQLNQRTKFGLAGSFIRSLNKIVNLGYQSYTSRMSASNAAIQDMLDNAITGVSPNYKIDFAKVTLSKGNLNDSPTMQLLTPVAGSKFVITWNPAELGEAEALLHGDDEAVFVLYDEQSNRFVTSIRSALRKTGKKEIDLPFIFAGHKLHAWAFFTSPNGKSVSDSQYLGSAVPIL
jgi:hypothetical protein